MLPNVNEMVLYPPHCQSQSFYLFFSFGEEICFSFLEHTHTSLGGQLSLSHSLASNLDHPICIYIAMKRWTTSWKMLPYGTFSTYSFNNFSVGPCTSSPMLPVKNATHLGPIVSLYFHTL
jgi:hypothetical protein